MILANIAARRYEAVIRCSEPILDILGKRGIDVPASIRIPLASALLSRSVRRNCEHGLVYLLRAISLLHEISESPLLRLYNVGRAYHLLGLLDLGIAYYRSILAQPNITCSNSTNQPRNRDKAVKRPDESNPLDDRIFATSFHNKETLAFETQADSHVQTGEDIMAPPKLAAENPIFNTDRTLVRAAAFNLYLLLLEQGEYQIAQQILLKHLVF
jgi:hypothetical protein